MDEGHDQTLSDNNEIYRRALQLEELKLNPEEVVAESSRSFCEICAETKGGDRIYTVQNCSHSFCTDCIGNHVKARLEYKTRTIVCPSVGCEGVIEFDSCSSILPKDVREKWDEILCESLILESQKFYCPFKDCSAMLVRDDETIKESECPICFRLFCAKCAVPWHPLVDCEEFQRLHVNERESEDMMLRQLAKEKGWNRCPRCGYFVEKTDGCLHMTCRCGFQFCYACGGTWTSTHGACRPQHNF